MQGGAGRTATGPETPLPSSFAQDAASLFLLAPRVYLRDRIRKQPAFCFFYHEFLDSRLGSTSPPGPLDPDGNLDRIRVICRDILVPSAWSNVSIFRTLVCSSFRSRLDSLATFFCCVTIIITTTPLRDGGNNSLIFGFLGAFIDRKLTADWAEWSGWNTVLERFKYYPYGENSIYSSIVSGSKDLMLQSLVFDLFSLICNPLIRYTSLKTLFITLLELHMGY